MLILILMLILVLIRLMNNNNYIIIIIIILGSWTTSERRRLRSLVDSRVRMSVCLRRKNTKRRLVDSRVRADKDAEGILSQDVVFARIRRLRGSPQYLLVIPLAFDTPDKSKKKEKKRKIKKKTCWSFLAQAAGPQAAP